MPVHNGTPNVANGLVLTCAKVYFDFNLPCVFSVLDSINTAYIVVILH